MDSCAHRTSHNLTQLTRKIRRNSTKLESFTLSVACRFVYYIAMGSKFLYGVVWAIVVFFLITTLHKSFFAPFPGMDWQKAKCNGVHSTHTHTPNHIFMRLMIANGLFFGVWHTSLRTFDCMKIGEEKTLLKSTRTTHWNSATWFCSSNKGKKSRLVGHLTEFLSLFRLIFKF